MEAICEHLEAVADGRLMRLLINVPPGFAKSVLTSVYFPAWLWGPMGRPQTRFFAFSYGSYLTLRDNQRFRDLIRSPRYQELWGGGFELAKEGEIKVSNSETGWKFASSVTGISTGERSDILIADDLHNMVEAESASIIEKTGLFFEESMPNRLNNLKTGAIIVIGQRVQAADVSGIIIDKHPEYCHLCIPMEYEEGRHCETEIGWRDWRSGEGELAWPERFPAETLTHFKSNKFMWSSQYQQRPEPRGGGIIKREYWRLWDAEAQANNDVKIGTYPAFDYIIAYFDGAMGQKQENDFSALTVWGTFVETDAMQRAAEQFGTPSIMLIAAWRKKLTLHGKTDLIPIRGETKEEFEDRKRDNWGLVEHIAETCRKFKVNKLLIEAKVNGHDIANEIRRLYSREDWMVVMDDPGIHDKTARTYSIQHFFADGRIWRPDTDWADMVETEMAQFPKGAHDDLHDTAVGALRHLRRMGLLVRADENSAAVEELQFPSKPQRKVLYDA